ncbi:MAG: hypothetical protein KC978_04000 [Candidatus Omnitrophica bacterium]|nr:hypothetical protein [Candidatus Omnitrophota bacterium]
MQKLLLTLALFTPLLASAEQTAWWERETEMAPGGILRIDSKPWWDRAKNLKLGESMVLKDPGMMILKREKLERGDGEMLVWIIDDDGDMDPNHPEGDEDSDCYVVDYGPDGEVDRMVDYIDEDGDQVPDEMEHRYYVDGELRRAWFGMDLDGDGHMWHLIDYDYKGDFFLSDPYDDNMIYMNKYNPNANKWLPISECPFAFFDLNNDGASDRVARFSAAPISFSETDDPDYANSQKRYQGPYYKELENIGVMNIRYSFDIDNLASDEHPLHYEMGFNLIAAVPYQYEGMEHTQPLRRAPKTTICVPHSKVIEVAESYPADQTGFTWREFEDAAMKIGYHERPEYDRRWEGVFWTWHRRIMQNTGGPVQDWNVRREFMDAPANKREVYYSPVDRRIHLKGATEGWIQVGHLFGEEKLGEIRMFDTNADGYFDRWEYIDQETGAPIRVASVRDAENIDFGNDWDKLAKFYNEEALPESIRLNEELISELEKHLGNEAAEVETEFAPLLAREEMSPDERRYLLDLVREYFYYLFRMKYYGQTKTELESLPGTDPRFDLQIMKDSTRSWDRAVLLGQIDAAYEVSDYSKVTELLRTNDESF